MFRHTGRTLLACAATVVFLASPGSAEADVLNDWNLIAQTQTIPLRPTAHGQTRGIAMVQGAVYDAVNAIDRGYQPYLLDVDALGIEPFGSYDAAIATAAHHVLVAIVPPAQVAGLDGAYEATLAAIPDGPIKDEGVAPVRPRRRRCSPHAQNDGFLAPFPFVIGTRSRRLAAGDAAPALDPDAWVGNAASRSSIESPSQFRSEGPNPLTSAALRGGLQRGEGARLADQHDAHGGPDDRGHLLAVRAGRDLEPAVPRPRPPSTASTASTRPGCSPWSTSPRPTARSPAGTTSTTGTSGGRWPRSARPTPTATRRPWPTRAGSRCSTRRRRPTPPLATPPFPDHPSGHGCVSGAVLHTVQEFFGTDKIAFDVHSGRFPGAAAALRPLLARAEGGHRRPRLGRHPLPHRRRAGRRDRQEGGPLAPQALLRAGALITRFRRGGLEGAAPAPHPLPWRGSASSPTCLATQGTSC